MNKTTSIHAKNNNHHKINMHKKKQKKQASKYAALSMIQLRNFTQKMALFHRNTLAGITVITNALLKTQCVTHTSS